jgi:uncharacterized RDD family membrane protein YckC
MNCPVCDRLLAPTLSICPACGAMMNDTVREELQSKIVMGAAAVRVAAQPKAAPAPRPKERVVTANLVAPKTSPTLVEFQNKQTALPDWRLQMQNAVRQRKGVVVAEAAETAPAIAPVAATAAAAAKPALEPIRDPRVNNALNRINNSRATFTPNPAAKRPTPPMPATPRPAMKLGVVPNGSAASAAAPSRIQPVQRPKLVVPPAPKRITNQLPPIETVEPLAVEEKIEEKKIAAPVVPFESAEIDRIRIHVSQDAVVDAEAIAYEDDIEDLAPISMRFGAGLFDLITGAFIAMAVMSPVILAGGDWSTASGALLFAGIWAAVMFIYMTACLGFVGKTLGMRLFSLELVDAYENEYPTLQQAAINSAVYLVTLPLAGAGFLTVFYNEENRALHDLLSGTIQVKEF